MLENTDKKGMHVVSAQFNVSRWPVVCGPPPIAGCGWIDSRPSGLGVSFRARQHSAVELVSRSADAPGWYCSYRWVADTNSRRSCSTSCDWHSFFVVTRAHTESIRGLPAYRPRHCRCNRDCSPWSRSFVDRCSALWPPQDHHLASTSFPQFMRA